ncbi:MAG: protein kinase [Gemmatimonadales bacterium]
MADRPSSIPAAVRDALAGRYRIAEEIGVGATAVVCRAIDERHNRTVALKILHSDLVGTAVRDRFLREIEFAARLQHPHIVPLLEAGEAGGSVFLAMPLVEGETLRDRLDRDPPLSIGEIVRIVVDLADALNYAHQNGVVHRDLKPANILLAGRHALLTDFGVAKALHLVPGDPQLTQGMAVGTPTYMSPEQASGSAAVDHRADLYALGVVAYEMVAGRRPFLGKTPQEVLTAHVVMKPEPIANLRPDLPREIAQVIDTCLAKDPADRFGSAAELVERLEALVDASGKRPSVSGTTRSRWWIGAAAAAIAVLALLWTFGDRGARTAPVRPEQLSFLGTVREAALSPDGALVAYVTAGTSGQRLWVRDAHGVGDALGIVTSERIVGLTWVNDGREISFAEGPVEAPLTRAVSPLGGTSRVLGRGRGVVSPDGNLVLIASGGDPTLLVLRPETGDTISIRRPVDGWTSGVAWAPGSDRLVISVLAPDRSRSTIWAIDLAGAASVIRAESLEVQAPRWSPGGDAVYYLAGPRGRAKDLRRVRLGRGGTAELIAANLAVPEDSRRHPTGSALSLSGDGRQAVVVQGESWSNLARFRLKTGQVERRPTPDLFTMGTALYSSPRLSPDGESIAVFVSTARGTTLGTVPLLGSAITELTTVTQGGGWPGGPTGRAVAYTGEVGDSGLRLFTRELAAARSPGSATWSARSFD